MATRSKKRRVKKSAGLMRIVSDRGRRLMPPYQEALGKIAGILLELQDRVQEEHRMAAHAAAHDDANDPDV